MEILLGIIAVCVILIAWNLGSISAYKAHNRENFAPTEDRARQPTRGPGLPRRVLRNGQAVGAKQRTHSGRTETPSD